MKRWQFTLASLVGLSGFVSIFTAFGYYADKTNSSTLFLGLGVILVVGTIAYIAYKYNQQGGNPNKG
jgi:membrane protein DedA with SNARE-associated domain